LDALYYYNLIYIESFLGTVKLNDEIQVVGFKPIAKIGVTGIEMFNKLLDYAEAGENVGILLRAIKREDVARGMLDFMWLVLVCEQLLQFSVGWDRVKVLEA